nr:hypothetical protein [Tanacetum cinerariifolium]
MTSLTSMCKLACQIVQKKQEEKQIEEEQAAKAQNWKLPACYDDDDDEEIIPNEPVDSLSMGDEHLNTISATKSDKFIKSSVENLVPNLSEFEGEYECDVPVGFTTFSNVLFDADYDFDYGDDQSFSDEDLLKKIYSSPLFDEEIIPMKIDQHPFNADDSRMEEIDLSFNPDDPMPPGIEEDDDDSKRDILICEELPSNYSLSLHKNESCHFDIPSLSRPSAKPPDGNTGILNIKMMGEYSKQKVPMPGLMITLVSNQEKSPDLLSHQGLEAFQPSAECPMI